MKKKSFAFVVALALLCMGGNALAVVTECVSVNSSGVRANGMSINGNMSGDGRYVVFASDGDNLVSSDTNEVRDIFVFDRQTSLTERVSVSSGNPGTQANGTSCENSPRDDDIVEVPSISADSRYVVFSSSASNLVSDDTNGLRDVFVRDRVKHTTTRISVSSSGTQANGVCYYPSVSANGNRVVFVSDATNLVTGDTNEAPDVFLRDIPTGKTYRVNVSSDPDNAQAVGYAHDNNDKYLTAWISGDGQHVAFVSSAANLAANDENDNYDIFVRDLNASNPASGTTENVHVSSSGEQGNGFPWAHACYISFDGSIVTFSSDADNLVTKDTNGVDDIFVRDRNSGTTTRVSETIGGEESSGKSADPSCSSDGSLIGFVTWNSDNTSLDCYIVENNGAGLQQIAVDSMGSPLEGLSALPLLSSNGRYVALYNTPRMSDLGASRVMVVDRDAILNASATATDIVPVSESLASTTPELVSVSPASGTVRPGVWKTFTCVYSDPNGAVDLTKCRLLVNSIIASAGGAYFIYDRTTNKLYMNNNAGKQVGGVLRGTATTIQTENAILDCAGTTVNWSGNNLTITWKVQFKPTMAVKTCNLYMMASDVAANSSGWIDKGDCIINDPPTVTSVSPASGIVQPSVWKTFTCVYSDPNGASDLTKCKLVINSIISGSGGAYLTYDKSTNKLYMNNNAGTQIGGILRGAAGTIETENAILDCASTTATTSGNSLTITWKVQFKPVMAGKKCNLYMIAYDKSGGSSGWIDKGDCIINASPTLTSVSPASGTVQPGVWKTFTCIYSDINGASDLAKCRLLVNSIIASSGGAYFTYDRTTNKLYMNNNAGKQVGGVLRGTATIIQTENAILDCAGTTVNWSGNNLTITWKVQFKPTMLGKICNLYMMAGDVIGSSSGWIDKGGCIINDPPTVTSVSPASGTVQTGVWNTLTCVYSDPNGTTDLTKCKLVINNIISGSGGAYLTYDKATNKLYMTNNAGTQIGGILRGTATTIETENAILDCAGTTVVSYIDIPPPPPPPDMTQLQSSKALSNNDLVIRWRVQFKPVMAGKKSNLYMTASDLFGSSSGWIDKGDCIINAPPTLTSISPASGTVQPGVWKTFTAVYSDIDGAADLTKCRLLINSTIASAGGAYFVYDRTTNKLYMNNNAGQQIGGVVRGTATTIQSENAILDCTGTTVNWSGNNLTVTWKVQFKPTMAGKNCNLYMYATDALGSSQTWTSKGTVTVASPG